MGGAAAGRSVTPATLDQAAALHQAGEFDRAERLYRTLIEGPVEAGRMPMRLLALLLSQTGRSSEAVAIYDQLIASGLHTADIHLQRAAWLHGLGRLSEAVQDYDHALTLAPDQPETLNNRGAALEALGRPTDALASFDAALRLRPSYAQALYNRGVALDSLGRPAEALASYDQSLAVEPADPRAHNNRGLALAMLKRHAEAVRAYDDALTLRPAYAEALNNRSAALRSLRQGEAALESAERALALRPDYAEALNTRGLALASLGRFDAALESYARVLALQPANLEALNNAGVALESLGRIDDAFERYDAALAFDPDFAEAAFNGALALLRAGRFDEGWRRHEARWRRRGQPGPSFPDRTLWLGEEPIAGRTLLLHAEQGLGDTIQFCRYAPLAAAMGARVVLQVQPPVCSLMASLDGVATVIAIGETVPAFDRHTPLMSLPLALERPEPMGLAPYLRADDAKLKAWRARLPASDRPRVGLAWSGNPEHENDRNRSLAFATLTPLLDCDVQFVSLQTPVREADAAVLDAASEVLRVEAALHELTDTAALIAACDLVISVDTSVAHLAGALGSPVWILLPHHPDWRWGSWGEATAWYPTARLFRQSTAGDWAEVLVEVVTALSAL